MYNRLYAEYLPNGMVALSGPCFVTGKTYKVETTQKQLELYRNGLKAQDAFPNMPKEDREFIISGTSPEGWEQMFGEIRS